MMQHSISLLLKASGLFLLIILQSCNGSTATNCVGASNPIKISLNNNGEDEQVVTLFSHSDKDGFIKIGQFELDPYEVKDICLDKEDDLKNGLFVFNGTDAFGLTLESKETVKINLTGNKYQIISPEQLMHLIKAM